MFGGRNASSHQYKTRTYLGIDKLCVKSRFVLIGPPVAKATRRETELLGQGPTEPSRHLAIITA